MSVPWYTPHNSKILNLNGKTMIDQWNKGYPVFRGKISFTDARLYFALKFNDQN
jgi:hypothetical protein